MRTILAQHSPLHIPISSTHANHDDRTVWAQVKARSFLRHNSLACVEHSFQWVLQGPISSNFQPSTSPGTLIPSLKHISFVQFLCCSSLIRSGASTKYDSQIVITNLVISLGYLHKVAKQSDELDEAEGMTECNVDNAICAYRPPWMRPTNLESSSVQPLNVWSVLHDRTMHQQYWCWCQFCCLM